MLNRHYYEISNAGPVVDVTSPPYNAVDATGINAAAEALYAAGGGTLLLPFRAAGYNIDATLKKYANTKWLGYRTILKADPAFTGAVVELQDHHYRAYTGLNSVIMDIAMDGFLGLMVGKRGNGIARRHFRPEASSPPDFMMPISVAR